MLQHENFDARTAMGELNGLINDVNEKWEQIVFNIKNQVTPERSSFDFILKKGVQQGRLPYEKALEYQKAAVPKFINWGGIGKSFLIVVISFFVYDFIMIGLLEISIMKNSTVLATGITVFGFVLWLFLLIVYFIKRKKPVHELYYDKNSAELDYLINTEWSPKMKTIRENVSLFSSDRELREAYSEFDKIDIEVSKMTVRGRIKEKDKEEWKQMGKIGKVAGLLTIGAVAGLAGGLHHAGKNSFK